MQSRLVVKNFGPIDFVDLDLRNVNVFIGPQTSGKSALAKIYTIFKAPRKFIKKDIEKSFQDALEEYNISSFLKPETEIEFYTQLHTISYKSGNINYTPILLKKIEHLEGLGITFNANKTKIIKEIQKLANNFILFRFIFNDLIVEKDLPVEKGFDNLTEELLSTLINAITRIEHNLSTNAALYIPAERNFINIIKNASLNLILNNVPIPKHILAFGAEVERASIEHIDLGFLQKGLFYKSINNEDRIFTDNGHSIKLTEAASGIQSVLPVLIPILSHKTANHRSFVIEEPELNLFPIAQYELIKELESTRHESYWEDFGTIHTYTTHSPYILSALNNLLYANKVKAKGISKEDSQEINRQVGEIVSSDINPYYFTAYQISNGKAESIFDRETGLIMDNYIDSASDKLADDFDAMMNI